MFCLAGFCASGFRAGIVAAVTVTARLRAQAAHAVEAQDVAAVLDAGAQFVDGAGAQWPEHAA